MTFRLLANAKPTSVSAYLQPALDQEATETHQPAGRLPQTLMFISRWEI